MNLNPFEYEMDNYFKENIGGLGAHSGCYITVIVII